jgi:Fe2+ transport system protein FeoA
MLMRLDQAPLGVALTVGKISDPGFAARMSRLGVFEGSTLTRLNEEITVDPVKVDGPRGNVVLSAGLAARVVLHRDDDKRLPLLECNPGDSGHVEGLTGHDGVEASLKRLGVVENDRLTLVRRLPPMLYQAVVDGKDRVRLSTGLACKILGRTPTGERQFSSVGVGEPFTVESILAGEGAAATLEGMHIRPGVQLELTGVGSTQSVGSKAHQPIVCVTMDGLRLYFQRGDAARLPVST